MNLPGVLINLGRIDISRTESKAEKEFIEKRDEGFLSDRLTV